MARQVLEYCAKASQNKWRLATAGEAYLVLGDTARALTHHRQANNSPGVMPRKLDAMYQQAVHVASMIDDEAAAGQLEQVLR